MNRQSKDSDFEKKRPAPDEFKDRLRIAPKVSGTYRLQTSKPPLTPLPQLVAGELRLDVDRYYPQMMVSVSMRSGLKRATHFIASIKSRDKLIYAGKIWYSNLPEFVGKKITLVVKPSDAILTPKHKVVMSLEDGKPVTFEYVTSSFHPLTLEYDYASDASAFTSFDTGSHPNRPTDLPVENLTISTVYRRAGFAMKDSTGSGSIPVVEAGADTLWSMDEINDAMVTHFSEYSESAKWAAWIFFASLSTSGDSLGGIMFDDEDAPTRQGCAVFVNSFIADQPAGDPNAAAFVQRMRFWCACHELGHCMNLAHSWQKDYPSYGHSWVTLTNDPESRSLMNYPFLVTGGSTAYFADHEYKFDDSELVFLRHAPYQFVQPGNAEWFFDHGFEKNIVPGAPLELTLRANRPDPSYEFLECVVLELKLKNVSSGPRVVDEKVFARNTATITIQKKGQTARQHASYAKLNYRQTPIVLAPGESLYDTAFVSAGVNGFDLAEPGDYLVRCAVTVDGMLIVSNPLNIRIRPPLSFEEQRIAQDFFSRDVGRVLAFDGSRVLTKGLNVLKEVVEVLPGRRVARHAQVALGLTLAQNKKVMRMKPDRTKHIEIVKADHDESRKRLSDALLGDSREISATLSHVDYGDYMHQFIELLDYLGDKPTATTAANQLLERLNQVGAPESVKARAKKR